MADGTHRIGRGDGWAGYFCRWMGGILLHAAAHCCAPFAMSLRSYPRNFVRINKSDAPIPLPRTAASGTLSHAPHQREILSPPSTRRFTPQHPHSPPCSSSTTPSHHTCLLPTSHAYLLPAPIFIIGSTYLPDVGGVGGAGNSPVSLITSESSLSRDRAHRGQWPAQHVVSTSD